MTVINEKYFRIELDKAKSIVDKINETDAQEQLLSDINEVKSIIFRTLDYSVNYFNELHGTDKRMFFPILNQNQDMSDLEQDQRFIHINKY